jgi:hypothetical protein
MCRNLRKLTRSDKEGEVTRNRSGCDERLCVLFVEEKGREDTNIFLNKC